MIVVLNPSDFHGNISVEFSGTEHLQNLVSPFTIQGQFVTIIRKGVKNNDLDEFLTFELRPRINLHCLISLYSGSVYVNENGKWCIPHQFEKLSSNEFISTKSEVKFKGELVFSELEDNGVVFRESYKYEIVFLNGNDFRYREMLLDILKQRL